MVLHGENLIGSSTSSQGAKRLNAYDPAASDELEPAFACASAEEVACAMALADSAFAPFAATTAEHRSAFLEWIGQEVLALGDDLIDRCMAETGLPEARLVGERGRAVGQLRMFADLLSEGSWVDARIDRAVPGREPAPKPDIRQMLRPLGPVVVFGPGNFPLAFGVAGGDTASALAAGCPVVVKAHSGHPGTSELVGRAIQRAVQATGMPEGVFGLLQGRGREVGMQLVRHPATRAVGFTGSRKAGEALLRAALERPEPIPVYAEMGSLNPVFILPGALEERSSEIAAGLHQSVTLGVGQFCTNPGLVAGLAGEALDRFLARSADLFAATQPGTMLGSGIRDAYEAGRREFDGIPSVRRVAQATGAADPNRTEAQAALFATDAATFRKEERLHREVFGPCTLVVACRDRQELLAVAEGVEGQLTATLHATEADLATYGDLVAVLTRKAGRVIFNGFPTGVEVCPSMHHGGPFPATRDGRSTSVGTAAILRFCRGVCYQDAPQDVLPPALQDANPTGIMRLVDGMPTREPL